MIYVDDYRIPAQVGRRRDRWSHLTADTHDELLAFARRLGLRPEWLQRPGSAFEHFDVTDRVRLRAIAMGAQPVTLGEMARITTSHHQTHPAATQLPLWPEDPSPTARVKAQHHDQ